MPLDKTRPIAPPPAAKLWPPVQPPPQPSPQKPAAPAAASNGKPAPATAQKKPPHKETDAAFLLAALQEGAAIEIRTITGARYTGKVVRFGNYQIEISDGEEGTTVIYKSSVEALRRHKPQAHVNVDVTAGGERL